MKEFKTTLGELDKKVQELNMSGIVSMKFSRRGNVSVARNMSKIVSELEDYNNQKKELIEKYTDGKESINPQDANWEEFKKEFDELGSVEAVININVIAVEDLPEDATPLVCSILDFMIKEDEE